MKDKDKTINKDPEKLYSEEISLISSPDYIDYVYLNLRKIQEIRRSFSIPVVGIAGAEGKTTTKRMLSAILSQKGDVLETPLDCDSASVVTSTILKLNEKHRFALLELGIINPDQFKLAVEIAEPNIGLVTNIGEAHLSNLGDKFVLADAKMELIRNLPADGFAVLNVDDDLVSGMDAFSAAKHVVKFGFNPNAHFHASNIKFAGPEGISFLVNDYFSFNLPIYNITSVSNALAAIAVARILKFDFEEIQFALENLFEPLPGRGELINLGDVYILDYSYTATINSINKAVESLVQFKKYSKKLILVLGDLEDAGEKNRVVHQNLGYYISALPVDVVITVGENARLIGEGIRKINHTHKEIKHCEVADGLDELMMHYLEPHSSLLISGGKKMKMQGHLERLIQKIRSS